MDDLLLQVADLLQRNTHLKVEANLGRDDVDGWLTVHCAEYKYSWQVEAKNRLTRPLLAKLIFQDQILGNGESVVVAPYINENLAELCREKVDVRHRCANFNSQELPIAGVRDYWV